MTNNQEYVKSGHWPRSAVAPGISESRQPTRKVGRIFGICLICISGSVLAQSTSIPSSYDPAAKTKIEMEAEKFGKSLLLGRLTTCNSEIYTSQPNHSHDIFQLKNPRAVTSSYGELSAAERLNGLEWDGQVSLQCDAARALHGKKWTEWGSCATSMSGPLEWPWIKFQKKNGQWQETKLGSSDKLGVLAAIQCSNIK
jgi:hypothetical protein